MNVESCVPFVAPIVTRYSGRMKEVIKELLQRRVKLKMIEGIVGNLSNQVSERERRVREEYEKRFQR